ncbi:hypothetical protein [Salinisphaera sp. LB1]|uniref:hypothetical protein n=1 Tax=Salinisphaera sp. LB1 TaxID=2183911 RepID=UPI000FEFC2CD|nr:hypothetical protein [Salinisphaera sp. LB1]
MKYLLDTNVFNHVLDGSITLNSISPDLDFAVTDIQQQELLKTPDNERRLALLSVLHYSGSDHSPPVFAWDTDGAGFGQGIWASEDQRIVAEDMRRALNSKKVHHNNLKDALIAEAAYRDGYGLATGDRDLAEVAEAFGITVHRTY